MIVLGRVIPGPPPAAEGGRPQSMLLYLEVRSAHLTFARVATMLGPSALALLRLRAAVASL